VDGFSSEQAVVHSDEGDPAACGIEEGGIWAMLSLSAREQLTSGIPGGGVKRMNKGLAVGGAAALLWAAPSLVSGDHHEMAPGVLRAMADLRPGPGSQVSGTVKFFQHGSRVTVVADVRGLQPNSSHGFHIHEKGDCTPPDFTSAGGHFNPGNHPHSGPDNRERHAGDLGNLETGASGRGYKRLVVDNITLGEGSNSVIGRGVIVHAKMDDLKTQPTGDAGGRIACGVITRVMAEGAAMRR
jgi:superoxide dismutase, Cu-Zn family